MSQNSDSRSCSRPIDRLSNLPGSVIDNILKYLPLGEAVRTSILSREWRYKWVTIPHLIFDKNFFCSLKEMNHLLTTIIDQTLLRYKGDIIMFSIKGAPIINDLDVNRWLFFLSDHRVEDLSLSYWLPSHRCGPVLPTYLYAFDNLKCLYISDATVKLPSTFSGFSKIVSLKLINIDIEVGDLEKLISECPKLEDLVLCSCGTIVQFEIDAPNLKRFEIYGRFCSIYFKSPYLVEISICYIARTENPKPSEFLDSIPTSLLQILCNLPLVKQLELNSTVMKYMANDGVPVRLPKKLNLIGLKLEVIELGCKKDVDCTLCLIRSSPNLHTLDISLSYEPIDDEVEIFQCLKALQECNIVLSCLKHVKIDRFSGFKYEMEFVKLLLLQTPKLEKLEIGTVFHYETEKLNAYKILRELASYRQASSQAALIFD